jgi:signal transduction histidine kinase
MVEDRTKELSNKNRELEQEILERKIIEKRLREAKDKAERADQIKSEFLNTVSHELRTPLTSIVGFSSMIKENLEKKIFPLIERKESVDSLSTDIGYIREELNIIETEAERLTDMINNVLDLAKIEAGKVVWSMEEVGIIDVITHAVNAVTSLLDKKSLKIITRVTDTHFSVIGDKNRLIQVVTNLLSNAIKFSDKGEIIINVKNDNEFIRCEIKDSGCGIPKECLESVFEKFRQVTDTLSRNRTGTGLGLPICKEILDHHNGKIWVESEYGYGSVFIFLIPYIY